MEEQKA